MTGTIATGQVTSPPLSNGGSAAGGPPITPERGWLGRFALGKRADPSWARPALWALLVVTAVLYLWNITINGTSNTFYAAAVQAGSENWKAWFFGSLDTSNFITVDKPPASLWIMGLSARIFGFSSASMLVPEALMGIAAVALVFGAVRRSLAAFGPRRSAVGGLLAGFALAFTPAAALMFRFDNPDALLVLLMTGAAYAAVRAVPTANWKWLALVGVLLGFAFLTKMLQGLVVLPAFAGAYLFLANTTLRRRLVHLGIAAVALIVSAGWWVLVVALWPADARPYIGGSTNNTVLELVFGYNGLGRIFGGSGNSGGGGGSTGASGSSFGGATGLQRLFSGEMGLEISWLLPAALIALVVALILTRRNRRTDPARVGLIIWGGWLVVTGLLFSFMSGTIHPYYTVALAPAIAGVIGIGSVVLWSGRDRWLGRVGLGAMMAAAGVWSYVLLSENTDFVPWLRWVVLVLGILGALGFIIGTALSLQRIATVAVLVGLVGGLAGPVAYSIATVSVAHTGSIPSAGSSSSSAMGGFGGGTASSGRGGFPGGTTGEMPSGMTGGAPSGSSGSAPSGTAPGGTGSGTSSSSGTGTGTGSSTGSSAAAGGMGGGGTTTSAALTKLLKASDARWAAATDGSQSAATLELASDTAVMAIGGWSSDPAPTLAQFKAYVKAGDIGYYIVSSMGGGRGATTGATDATGTTGDSTTGSGTAPTGMGGTTSSSSTAIAAWVEANYTATTVGGSTVYDLSTSK